MFEDDILITELDLRFFAECKTEEEFNEVCSNPFIKAGNIVLYDNKAYIYTINDELLLASSKDSFDKLEFFHRYNIGDTLDVQGVKVVVIDYQVHFLNKKAFYVLKKVDTGEVMKVEVLLIDSLTATDDDTPCSILLMD